MRPEDCREYGHRWQLVAEAKRQTVLVCRGCGKVVEQDVDNHNKTEWFVDKSEWMKKNAPEILEEEERLELREQLLRQQSESL